MIPLKSRESIFQPGITTKVTGHGMGLYIVRKVLQDRGGDVNVSSDTDETEFSGYVPKEITPLEKDGATA